MIDELKISRGGEIRITDKITISQPTIGQICDISPTKGERDYLSFLSLINVNRMDKEMMVFLTDEVKVDFMEITNFDLFCMLITAADYEVSSLLFKGVNFGSMELRCMENGAKFLENSDGVRIDETIYRYIVRCIRKLHCLKEPQFKSVVNDKVQKRIAVSVARDELKSCERYLRFHPEEKERSLYLPCASGLIQKTNYNWETVFDLTVFQFWYSVMRARVIDNADHLYTGLYSGCLSFKNNPNLHEDLNWLKPISP